ncbi:MAG: hypothetical protein LAT51_01100 [Flavobacteriaceae bacterium]|nr:hypothetical protein [Flavobacteriaceae bacterium]
MKKYVKVLVLVITTIVLTSCSSDDDNSSSGGDKNVWIVYLQGTGSGGVDIEYDNEMFCYEDGECESTSGFTFVGTFGDSRLDITSSKTNRVASGVLMESIKVTSGSGKIEVVSASVREVDGFMEIEEGKTLFSSPELSSGDTYTLEFGEINN